MPRGASFCVNQLIKNSNFKFFFCYSNLEFIILLVNAYGEREVYFMAEGQWSKDYCTVTFHQKRHIPQSRNTQYLVL